MFLVAVHRSSSGQFSVAARSKREKSGKGGDRVIHRERAASTFARSFTLPEPIDQESSNAKYDNGVLTLELAN